MKAKTIKSVIRKKLNAWLSSIEDNHVRDLARKNTIVTGGCIASMLLKEKINDFDIYFRDYDTARAVAQYYIDVWRQSGKFNNNIKIEDTVHCSETDETFIVRDRVRIVIKSSGEASEEGYQTEQEKMDETDEVEENYIGAEESAQENEQGDYRPIFITMNAITLSDRVQLIFRFFGEPDEIHENYDFVHCTNYYDSKTGELVLRKEALEALLSRELRYVGSKYPLCSIFRTRKFIKRGWSINAGQYLKMALQLNEMNLLNTKVLEEQLTGVDSSYFVHIIDAINEKEGNLDTGYLIELINRIF